MTQVYRGTIAELADKITLGGKVLGQIELSNMTRLGNGTFARAVGTVPKAPGTRGRAATIWELSPEINMSFESQTIPLADPLPESANAPASDAEPTASE